MFIMEHLNTTEKLQVKTEKKTAGILWFLATETIFVDYYFASFWSIIDVPKCPFF